MAVDDLCARQWVAHWRGHTDNYTRSKIALVDRIASMVTLSDLEMYELAAIGPRTLELIIDLVTRAKETK